MKIVRKLEQPELPGLPAPERPELPKKPTGRAVAAEFAAFWRVYPKRRAKFDAEKAYVQARTRASADEILAGLRWQLTCEDWTRDGGLYIPYPATWLRAGRWMDDPDDNPFAWACPHTPPCAARNDCDVLKRLGR